MKLAYQDRVIYDEQSQLTLIPLTEELLRGFPTSRDGERMTMA
jgi:hypothetical protein